MSIELHHGDCLEVMKTIPDGSVDMIMCDPPYGTTACKWDSVIPFEAMWKQLKRVIKKNGAIVLCGSQPFTSALVMSNVKMFKYCWVWEKSRPTNIFHASNTPLKTHEDICIFSEGKVKHLGQKGRMEYNPQGVIFGGAKTNNPQRGENRTNKGFRPSHNQSGYITKGSHYPRSIVRFASAGKTVHPTQKPVALMEYMVKTYTNEGETVLDFTMGSGTTGVACQNLGRSFIGIELDDNYYKIAESRLGLTSKQKRSYDIKNIELTFTFETTEHAQEFIEFAAQYVGQR